MIKRTLEMTEEPEKTKRMQQMIRTTALFPLFIGWINSRRGHDVDDKKKFIEREMI
jgi:hypothetical protein